MFLRNRITFLAAVVAMQLAATRLSACLGCLGTPSQPTLAEDVRAAQDVVVVSPGAELGALEIRAVLKGDPALKGTPAGIPDARGTAQLLLTRPDGTSPWKSQGTAGLQMARFLDVVRESPQGSPTTDAEWADRLAVFRPYLGHVDPRLARSAWAEWSKAPYRVLRSQRLQAANLRSCLADPAHAYGEGLWVILLGLSGDQDDLRRLGERLEAAWKTNDSALLTSLLTARLEFDGAEGVAWVEERYIRDRDRTLPEILAAVTALAVHGNDHLFLRPRIQAAYRVFISERRPLSGLVASDLANWEDWSASESYRALLASGDYILPETRQATEAYLAVCPPTAPLTAKDP